MLETGADRWRSAAFSHPILLLTAVLGLELIAVSVWLDTAALAGRGGARGQYHRCRTRFTFASGRNPAGRLADSRCRRRDADCGRVGFSRLPHPPLDADFEALPWKSYTWLAVAFSSVAFAVTHGGRWLAGTIAGICTPPPCCGAGGSGTPSRPTPPRMLSSPRGCSREGAGICGSPADPIAP